MRSIRTLLLISALIVSSSQLACSALEGAGVFGPTDTATVIAKTAQIRTSAKATVGSVMVPSAAITHIDGKATVFVSESPTKFMVTPVELGASDGTDREVVSGLAAGQSVVTAGVFGLKSELFR